jgi:serine phosphatase RsbU (regulator of sigma subunit)/ketosteroid isomerase-like protein
MDWFRGTVRWNVRLGQGGRSSVSLEENKALVRRFLEEQAKGNLDVIDELLSPDFVDRGLLPGQGPTREDFKRSVTEILDAFSIISFTIEEQIAEGDTVVTKYTERSVITGEFVGLPPTGTEENFEGIYIHRISDGKITQEWSQANTLHTTLERLEEEMRERERVEQDLRVARGIQHALLPKDLPELEGWGIAHHYRPAREVGGDFYDFLDLNDGRVGLVIGDASGKGIPAALVMACTQSVLRAVAQRAGLTPGQALEEANEVLFTYLPPNMFVTCFYAILDPESGRLLYANAGHDLPYLRRGSDAEELRARGMPLGLMPGMSYEEGENYLREGDGALFYSDGLVEAHNPRREMFGTPRLEGLVGAHPGGAALIDSLMAELEQFTGEEWEQEDDITLLTLQRFRSSY